MTDQHFVVIFAQGTAEELRHTIVKTKGMTVIEVPEHTHDSLYTSLLERATTERREKGVKYDYSPR